MPQLLIETLEQVQAQTWWLPKSATVYEENDVCFYKLNGRYEIVRFQPSSEKLHSSFEYVLGLVNKEPVRFLFFPHRHGQDVLDMISSAGFKKGHGYSITTNVKPPQALMLNWSKHSQKSGKFMK
ncbi:MAG: hypothetical protein CMH49_03095 [Myxococcales bacterium]|nr:hypothetical protein [Myxococcales bacterium]